MRQKTTTIALFWALAVLLVAPAASAESGSRLRDAGGPGAIRLAGTEDPSVRKVYIVQMRTPSAGEHHAKLVKQAARTQGISKPRMRFDREHAAIREHAERIGAEQDRVISKLSPEVEKIYSYRYGLNGFAARMTPAEAHKLENMDEVQQVWEDEVRPLATNFSLDFLDLFNTDTGLRNARGLSGEDVVIAVIDSGIYPEHPALDDTQEADRPSACRGSWAESSFLGRWLCRRFDKMERTMLYEPLEDWSGECQAGERFEDTSCNNKLIGARYFIAGAEATGPIDEGEIRSVRDVDGHGTHVATTVAGNSVRASIFGTQIGRVQGVAPRARLAVYKACWLRPGQSRASCNTSDLANAIDAAVADGVDLINYSVGTTFLKITSPDDLALMAATKAGVLAVVSAGNEGPNLGSIGSPAGGPWAITVAASSRDGETSVEAMQIESPPVIAGRYAVREASFTPPLKDRDPIEGMLVLVDDDDDTLPNGGSGTTSDACQPLINDTEIEGNIAFIQRGGCDFDIKVLNAADAGAIAALVYSNAGDPIVMTGSTGLSDIPALMIGQADGNLVIAEFDAGNEVEVVLDKGLLLTEPDLGNLMGVFSSRGPGVVADILKPDVTAPGIDILAGYSPEVVNATPDETFAYLTGTSMSTPHVAGVAALLMEAYPEWSPAAIKSALMTTARQDVLDADALGPATPFDFGAGHIAPNDAFDPGLVYDVSDEEYDAFACGTESPAVSEDRCGALESAGFSFDAADMNQPSIAISGLANQRTVTRRVTNVSDTNQNFLVNTNAPPGMALEVVPSSLSLAPGETASYDVTLRYLDGPLDLWRFGSMAWTSGDHIVRTPIAVKPTSINAPLEMTSFGGSGTLSFNVEFGYTGSYAPRVHGLNLPLIIDGFVDNDPTKTFTFRSVNGVTAHLIDVPPDQLYVRFATFDALTDGDDDLDMYVYFCPDDVNCVRLGESGEPTSQERFDIFLPAAGRYAVLIHGFETDEISGGPGANYKLLGWSFGQFDDPGNMQASGPSMVTTGTTDSITVTWSNLLSETIYFGGISHNTPQGLSGLTLITIGN